MEIGTSLSVSAPRRAPLPLALDLIFTSGRFDPRITFTRGDTTPCATRFGPDGLLKVMGINMVPNSSTSGAVLGTSTLPTLWSLSNSASTGLTSTVVGLGTDSQGYPYIDWRVTGTSTTGGALGFRFFSTALTATASTTYTGSTYVTLVGGSNPTGVFSFGFDSAVSGTYNATTSAVVSAPSTTRTQMKVTGATSATANQISGLYIYYTGVAASQVVDVTLRISGVQLELGSVANDYSYTQGTATSGPRLNHDPSTPNGTTGVELVPTTFTTWTLGQPTSGSVTVTNGVLSINSIDGSYCGANVAPGCTAGKTYKYTITVASAFGSGVAIAFGGNQMNFASAGTYTGYLPAATTTSFEIKRGGPVPNTGGTVTYISIQEATFAPRGLMVEEARTNLLLWSRDMTNAAWTSGSLDITPTKNQVGIDGVANSACLITEGVGGSAVLTQTGGGITAGATVTGSAIMKRGNTDWIRMGVRGSALANGCNAWFNLATGQKGQIQPNGTGSGWTNDIKSLGNGWYRVIVTGVIDATSTNAVFIFVSAPADGNTARVNNATYIVDFTQIEAGATASSPIITGASTVTRAADTPLMNGTNFTSWYTQAQGTFVVEFDSSRESATGAALIRADDGGLTNRLYLQVLTGTNAGLLTNAAGSATDGISAPGVYTAGSIGKVAAAYSGGNYKAICFNGNNVQTGTLNVPSSAINQMFIGTNAGANWLNGHIRRIQFYANPYPAETLKALTA